MSFKEKLSLEERKNESTKIINKFPDKIPIIIEISNNSDIELPKLDKYKYLVPNDITLGQFVAILRKRMTLKEATSIFVFVNNCVPKLTELVSIIYNKEKDEDGFLYLNLASENVFGN